MSAIWFFLGGVIVSIVCSFVTIAVIRRSYREIVEELCGTASRAGYWIKASEACLVIIAVFAAITFHRFRAAGQADTIALFWGLISQIACILGAIFISLIVISLVIFRSLPRRENRVEFPNQ